MSLLRLLAVILALSLPAWACAGKAQQGPPPRVTIAIMTPTPKPTPRSTPTPTLPPLATPTATPSPNVCLFNPDPATAEELQLLAPALKEGQEVLEVKSPIFVGGWGSEIGRKDVVVTIALVELVNDKMQLIPVFDTEGVEGSVVEATALPLNGQKPPPGLKATEFTRPFAEDIGFKVKEPKSVCLWVFVQAAGSTEPQDVVQVPLRLMP